MLFKKNKKEEVIDNNIYYSNVKYFNNSYIRDKTGRYYFISNNKKYLISSERILQSWAPPAIALSDDETMNTYKLGGRLGFRNGTLILDISSNLYYLIVENKKRKITSPDTLDSLGYSIYDAITVSETESKLHETGEDLV